MVRLVKQKVKHKYHSCATMHQPRTVSMTSVVIMCCAIHVSKSCQ